MRDLGPLAAYVRTGLNDARREMGHCFEADAAVRARAADPDAAPTGPAVLLLYLEARDGALDVIDTRVEYLGDSSPELVDCCRTVLRGYEISAFNAKPGQRYRVKYQLE
jgi:hypothetical protein